MMSRKRIIPLGDGCIDSAYFFSACTKGIFTKRLKRCRYDEKNDKKAVFVVERGHER